MTKPLDTVRAPLTLLSLGKELFRNSVRKFARENVAPLVREMDAQSLFSPELLDQFFRLGWMGIEIPEEFGGSGVNFVQCILAIEELSA